MKQRKWSTGSRSFIILCKSESKPGFQPLAETLQESKHHHLRLYARILEGEKDSASVLVKTFLYGVRVVWAP
jgi:hypothetical protein